MIAQHRLDAMAVWTIPFWIGCGILAVVVWVNVREILRRRKR